ncbi:MAG: hypothetical protein JWN49_309 [Parcubacteria group bacterium]|nr:hypothetical protein [Parcubacteria group bacterium]
MTKSYIQSTLVFVSGGATILSMYVFFNRPEFILLSLILLGLLIVLAIRNWKYAVWYIVAFVLGPVILDLPGLHLGLWSYGTPEIFGFPFWLPFFYGNITVSFIFFVLTTQQGLRD